MKKIILSLIVCLVSIWSWAENQYHDHIDRSIKTLSDKDINDLSQGYGMGFAIAAELNHYPRTKACIGIVGSVSAFTNTA